MRQIPENCCVPGPNAHVMSLVAKHKPTSYAEIGIYEGATAVEVAKLLSEPASMHLFDFENRVFEAQTKLGAIKELENKQLKVHSWSNTHKMFDSYNWNLAKCLKQGITFDFVFVDGAHSWHHDALAFFLIDQMLEDGGIVVLDDYGWSLATSPTMNPSKFPEITQQYTQEQIETPQVNMVVDLLVEKMGYQSIISKVAYQKAKLIGN